MEAWGFRIDMHKSIKYNELRHEYFLIGPVSGLIGQPNWTFADHFLPLQTRLILPLCVPVI